MEKGVIKKGFKAFRSTIKDDNKKLRQIRACSSCLYQHKSEDDHEEICHNNSVTPFDMVEEGNVKYCTFWKPSWHKD